MKRLIIISVIVLITAVLAPFTIVWRPYSEPGDPVRFELYEDVCLLESGETWVPVHMKYCKPQGGRIIDLY